VKATAHHSGSDPNLIHRAVRRRTPPPGGRGAAPRTRRAGL